MNDEGHGPQSVLKRLLWFAFLWAASVAMLAVIAFAIRSVLMS